MYEIGDGDWNIRIPLAIHLPGTRLESLVEKLIGDLQEKVFWREKTYEKGIFGQMEKVKVDEMVVIFQVCLYVGGFLFVDCGWTKPQLEFPDFCGGDSS